MDPIDQLVAGELDRVTVQPDGQMMLSAPRPLVLLPGSFNPLHEGHVSLARAAGELRRQPVAFETSVTNVDKAAADRRDGETPACGFAPESGRSNSREPPPSSRSRACFRGLRS